MVKVQKRCWLRKEAKSLFFVLSFSSELYKRQAFWLNGWLRLFTKTKKQPYRLLLC